MASFPTTVYSPASVSAGQTVSAALFNDPYAEITAIESALINGPLNLGASTMATLSVSGGSTLASLNVTSTATFGSSVTFSTGITLNGPLTISSGGLSVSTGNVTIGSTGGGSTLTLRGSTTTCDITVHALGFLQQSVTGVLMTSGSTRSLGATAGGFLFVDEGNSANSKGGIFYLRGTANLVSVVSDPDSELSTIVGGGAGSTGKLCVGFTAGHYTIENHLGGAATIRMVLLGV